MLINSYTHTIDAKGRVFIPAKWRDDLGDTVIVTRGMLGQEDSRCLFGMSLAAWKEFYERFRSLAVSDVRAQNVMRVLFANACECEMDKQGRILIDAALREYAQISEDAVLIGMVGRIEIWNPAGWKAHSERHGDVTDEALQYMMEQGI